MIHETTPQNRHMREKKKKEKATKYLAEMSTGGGSSAQWLLPGAFEWLWPAAGPAAPRTTRLLTSARAKLSHVMPHSMYPSLDWTASSGCKVATLAAGVWCPCLRAVLSVWCPSGCSVRVNRSNLKVVQGSWWSADFVSEIRHRWIGLEILEFCGTSNRQR